MFDILPWTLMGDKKVKSGEEHEGELSMFKTPRRSRRRNNTSSTPTSASNPVPDPTNKDASEPAKKVRRSTRAKKRTISFVNHPINESFEFRFCSEFNSKVISELRGEQFR